MVLCGCAGARALGLLGLWVILDLVMCRSADWAGLEGVGSAAAVCRAAEVLWRVRREVVGFRELFLAKVRAKVQLGQAIVVDCQCGLSFMSVASEVECAPSRARKSCRRPSTVH